MSLNFSKLPGWSLWISLWLLWVIVSLLHRTFLPIDETRYVAVAWEMWLRGDWLVPHLNGIPYHHKPPLLFWLICVGWSIFGVNDWIPRIIPSLFSLASLWLTVYLARQLWLQQPRVADYASLVLCSCALWIGFTTATMFDILLTFCTLLGMVALVRVWQTKNRGFWGLFGLAIGLGTLTKGPVILLHLLPVAILAPWWQRTSPVTNWKSWYFGMLMGVAIGALLALAWAIPAALQGGEEYRNAIFWGQTAHRVVNSFAHRHPVWWYLPLLPIMLFPWLFWLPTWRGLKTLLQYWHDSGVRFCGLWFLCTFLGFSLISGKQPHYLLPIFPAFALIIGFLVIQLPDIDLQRQNRDMVIPGAFILLIGIGSLLLPYLSDKSDLISLEVTKIIPLTGVALLLLGLAVILCKSTTIYQQLAFLSLISVLFITITTTTVLTTIEEAYDLRGISRQINLTQQNNQPIVHIGVYHGQFHFLGRLLQPLEVIERTELATWYAQHPQGKVIVYFSGQQSELTQQADYVQPYRSKYVGIIQARLLVGRESLYEP